MIYKEGRIFQQIVCNKIHKPVVGWFYKEWCVYSPKIHEEHIKRLYPLAKKMDMPMTKLVNLILAVAIEELEDIEDVDAVVCYEPARPEEPV